jgi:hypothetical protein
VISHEPLPAVTLADVGYALDLSDDVDESEWVLPDWMCPELSDARRRPPARVVSGDDVTRGWRYGRSGMLKLSVASGGTGTSAFASVAATDGSEGCSLHST